MHDERRAAVGDQREVRAGGISMLEPSRPVSRSLELHVYESLAGVHGEPVASLLQYDGDFPLGRELQEALVDVRHEDVAFRIDDDAGAGMRAYTGGGERAREHEQHSQVFHDRLLLIDVPKTKPWRLFQRCGPSTKP